MGGESEGKKARRPVAAPAAHGGHHGGAWKVAYADFTTAMMAFFLLMWILSSASPTQKEAIANYFRDDGPFRDGGATKGGGALKNGSGMLPESGDAIMAARTQKLQEAEQEIREGLGRLGGGGPGENVHVSMSAEGLVIEIVDDEDEALFGVGSAAMNPRLGALFDTVASHISGLPNPVRIEGYTDARQYASGASYSNWELSADRANAARRRLETHGLARDRFESIVGYADGYPALTSDPNAPANRRITITVLDVPDAQPGGTGATPALPAASNPDVPTPPSRSQSPVDHPVLEDRGEHAPH